VAEAAAAAKSVQEAAAAAEAAATPVRAKAGWARSIPTTPTTTRRA